MRSPETGPEIFEQTHSPELAPLACLADEIYRFETFDGDSGAPRASIKLQAEIEEGTLVLLGCQKCAAACTVLHKDWKPLDIQVTLTEGAPDIYSCPFDQ